jgi:hypothetical protein
MSDVNRIRIYRQKIAEWLDVKAPTAQTSVWGRIGAGVSTGQLDINPETESIQDLDMDVGTDIVTNIKPSMGLEFEETDSSNEATTDPVNDWLCNNCRNLVKESPTTWLRVYLHKSSVVDGVTTFLAYKIPASFSIETGMGGDSGAAISGSGTLKYTGDQVKGTVTFDENNKPIFTADAA